MSCALLDISLHTKILSCSELSSDLVVLSVTYGPLLSNISIQVVFRYRFNSPPESFSLALCLDSELVAVAKTTPELQIYVFNYALGQSEPSILYNKLGFDARPISLFPLHATHAIV